MGIKAVTVVDFATTMTIRKVSSVVSQKCAHEQISMFTEVGVGAFYAFIHESFVSTCCKTLDLDGQTMCTTCSHSSKA